ncbi:geranylgeranyl pyrophosphate synthase [Acuticoccus sediminis]|uniref:Probable farnesyl diphosphate synthase n=1 Tax=Acuticoccus sediminis TaxID=2184697 RepID=A0A8B2NKN8_9HYPH|nr:polyprenyl synthetase family protein [Acuticoccus sediminis]RAH98163.1 geranylgeranyl pyrophosphate synthase [Acuticoccus sediminis]
MDFAARLAAAAEATNRVMDQALQPSPAVPDRLLNATRYATLAGGKRFRPFLVIESAALFDAPADAAAAVAAAFECLHSYSLVHDDLPAMDDDDLRRGQPTVHKAYDEATAILVGDGLQALAFELITGDPVPSDVAGPLAHLLARASGNAGMVGGQYRDLNAIGLDAEGIRLMQAMKTGRLIAGACEAGAVLGRADAGARAALVRYGDLLGEAFQLADDLLDVEGTAEETGKRVGKDAGADKATLVGLIGPAAARARLAEIVAAAADTLAPFGDRASVLREASRFVADRRS